MSYTVDLEQLSDNLNVPSLRQEKHVKWIYSLMAPLVWIQDRFFTDYVNGATYSAFNHITSYSFGDIVIYKNAVYMSIVDSNANHYPDVSPTYWYMFQSDYRGYTERKAYNGQKAWLEYVLNKEFNGGSLSMPYIYFDTSSISPWSTPPAWSIANSYNYGDLVSYGGALYRSKDPALTVAGGSTPPTGGSGWEGLTISTSLTGISSYFFTINVPSGVYTGLGGSGSHPNAADSIISAVALKFLPPGICFKIVSY